jgi:hypothetical protein
MMAFIRSDEAQAADLFRRSSGAFPRIAGQSAYYLKKQMRDFAALPHLHSAISWFTFLLQ